MTYALGNPMYLAKYGIDIRFHSITALSLSHSSFAVAVSVFCIVCEIKKRGAIQHYPITGVLAEPAQKTMKSAHAQIDVSINLATFRAKETAKFGYRESKANALPYF